MADRSRDPEAVEREIERGRQTLARTIDEITVRVNPRNVAHRGAERLAEEAGHVAKAVGAIVRPAEDDRDDEERAGGALAVADGDCAADVRGHFDALAAYPRADPLLELGSSAAIRTSVVSGVGPAVLSTLAIADDIRTGGLRTVEVDGLDLTRRLRAVWRPPRELRGPAADLVRITRKAAS